MSLAAIVEEAALMRRQNYRRAQQQEYLLHELARRLALQGKDSQAESILMQRVSMLQSTIIECFKMLQGQGVKRVEKRECDKLKRTIKRLMRQDKQSEREPATTHPKEEEEHVNHLCLGCQEKQWVIQNLKKKNQDSEDSLINYSSAKLSQFRIESFVEQSVCVNENCMSQKETLCKRMLQKDRELKGLRERAALGDWQACDSQTWSRLVNVYQRAQPRESIHVIESLSLEQIVSFLQNYFR